MREEGFLYMVHGGKLQRATISRMAGPTVYLAKRAPTCFTRKVIWTERELGGHYLMSKSMAEALAKWRKSVQDKLGVLHQEVDRLTSLVKTNPEVNW